MTAEETRRLVENAVAKLNTLFKAIIAEADDMNSALTHRSVYATCTANSTGATEKAIVPVLELGECSLNFHEICQCTLPDLPWWFIEFTASTVPQLIGWAWLNNPDDFDWHTGNRMSAESLEIQMVLDAVRKSKKPTLPYSS